ncbi:hypothetical protein ABZ926_14750 [Streptomyces litmocidini]|uniref:hypothetical protein n=1 Tax=Streptomyces litmocidini TaxID=67318 RepID=UPI003410EDAE
MGRGDLSDAEWERLHPPGRCARLPQRRVAGGGTVPALDQVGGRWGRRDYRLGDLFPGSPDKAALFASLFLPFAVAGLLVLAAVVLRSRLVMAAAGVLVLGFTILWMVRQGQAADGLTVGGSGAGGLGEGVANAFGGGVLILLAAVAMRGRRCPTCALPRATGPRRVRPMGRVRTGGRGGSRAHYGGRGSAGCGGRGPGHPPHPTVRDPARARAGRHRSRPRPGPPAHEHDPSPDGPHHGPPLGPPLDRP